VGKILYYFLCLAKKQSKEELFLQLLPLQGIVYLPFVMKFTTEIISDKPLLTFVLSSIILVLNIVAVVLNQKLKR